jgi:hypothetical protein
MAHPMSVCSDQMMVTQQEQSRESTMNKTIAQAIAAVCAAVLTVATFAGANEMAKTEYARADAAATTQSAPVLALQKVVIVGHRV